MKKGKGELAMIMNFLLHLLSFGQCNVVCQPVCFDADPVLAFMILLLPDPDSDLFFDANLDHLSLN